VAGQEPGPDRDPDDWFDDPEPPAARGAVTDQATRDSLEPGAHAEDWLAGETQPTRRRRTVGSFDPRLAAGAALGVVALLAIVLALSGVFSSGTPRRTTTTPPTTHATTTTPTTTATQTTATTLPAPTGPLKPGDQGAQVKVLQRALASLGYSTGTADGIYGPSTKTAVAAFQKASNLTADGILGPQTLLALSTALKGP
jgi:murein L,D-transpeptidase YcbB/YkuD